MLWLFPILVLLVIILPGIVFNRLSDPLTGDDGQWLAVLALVFVALVA